MTNSSSKYSNEPLLILNKVDKKGKEDRKPDILIRLLCLLFLLSQRLCIPYFSLLYSNIDEHMYLMYLLSFSRQYRRTVVAAGDYVRLRSLHFAPTHIHRPYPRRYRVGCSCRRLRNQQRLSAQPAKTFCAIGKDSMRNRSKLSAQSLEAPCAIKNHSSLFCFSIILTIYPKHKDVSPKTSLCFE
jgi:hypothetical protein